MPFPGSDTYSQARQKGFITTDDWTMFEQNFSILDTPQLSAIEVMQLREKIVKGFYLNPRKIFKHLIKIKSWQEF